MRLQENAILFARHGARKLNSCRDLEFRRLRCRANSAKNMNNQTELQMVLTPFRVLTTKANHRQICIAFLALSFALTGCITGGKYPEASKPGYEPRVTYDASFDKVWKAVNDTLDKNHIAVVSTDQTAGRMQTDYVTGPTVGYFGGLGGLQNSRGNYNIRITREDSGKTKLLILGKYETAYQGGNNNALYKDVSGQNPKVVKGMENWLYEQIEKQL
jgi:uncharacterized lipoprotein